MVQYLDKHEKELNVGDEVGLQPRNTLREMYGVIEEFTESGLARVVLVSAVSPYTLSDIVFISPAQVRLTSRSGGAV